MDSQTIARINQALAAGRADEARQLCDSVLRAQPDDADAGCMRGVIALHAGAFGEAADVLAAAVRRHPSHGPSHVNLGFALMKLGRPAEAVEVLLRGIELDAASRQVWDALRACARALEPADGGRTHRRLVAAHAAHVDRLTADRRPRFHFLRDNAPLTDQEFALARRMIDAVGATLAERSAQLARNPAAALNAGAGNWSADNAQSVELDGAALNYVTSYRLIAAGEYRVIDQLRLYGQSFTGYQLATLSYANHMPWLREPLPVDVDRLLLAPRAAEPCPSVGEYRFLRDYILHDFDEVSFPAKFGEVGWEVGAAIVNYDLAFYLSHIADLVLAGVLPRLRDLSAARPLAIVEIGGGFGGLAYLLQQLLPNSHYVIVDLPESLAFSAAYLGTLRGGRNVAVVDAAMAEALRRGEASARGRLAEPGVTLVPNHHVDALATSGLRADLGVNTISLDEMAPPQIDGYARVMAEMLADGAVFFEVNHDGIAPILERHLRRDLKPSPVVRTRRPMLQETSAAKSGYCVRFWRRPR
jgi:Tetratricopeptide repeat